MGEGLPVQKHGGAGNQRSDQRSDQMPKLLIAASGTGGHLFPAIATAQQLPNYAIEWLGVPDRLETELVPTLYKLHTVKMSGVQGSLGLGALKQLAQFASSTVQVRQLLKRGRFQGVFTTGGYIAAPAILAARSLGLPAVLHESNALPGKVTRFLSPWCTTVALGFKEAAAHLPKAQTVVVGTPVRSQFISAASNAEQTGLPDIDIPADVPLIAVVGGSQGAVAVNQLVRAAAPAWLEAGAWIVHITGTNDPDAESFSHPHYIRRPFYSNMAALFGRANLVVSRAGAGTLIELAVTGTPSILIPYPFAAEDHQTFNAIAFQKAEAAQLHQQSELSAGQLQAIVTDLLSSPEQLDGMARAARQLATVDSAAKMAEIISAQLSAHLAEV